LRPPFSALRTLCSNVVNEELAASIVGISNSLQNNAVFESIIRDEIDREKQLTSLFRTDSCATKMMRFFSNIYGIKWLTLAIGDLVKEIVNNPGNYEVDSSKLPPGQTVEANLQALRNTTIKFLESILTKGDNIPNEIRRIGRFLKEEVEKKYPGAGNIALAGFFFLRFICPAILNPKDILKVPQVELSPESQRHLLLITKTIQNIANGVEFGAKEFYMQSLNNLVHDYIPKVQRYLQDLSGGLSNNAIETTQLSSSELMTEIETLFKQITTNINIIEQNLQDDKQKSDFFVIKNQLQQYDNLLVKPKKNEVRKNKFTLFH